MSTSPAALQHARCEDLALALLEAAEGYSDSGSAGHLKRLWDDAERYLRLECAQQLATVRSWFGHGDDLVHRRFMPSARPQGWMG